MVVPIAGVKSVRELSGVFNGIKRTEYKERHKKNRIKNASKMLAFCRDTEVALTMSVPTQANTNLRQHF
jgi:hypothetical protein